MQAQSWRQPTVPVLLLLLCLLMGSSLQAHAQAEPPAATVTPTQGTVGTTFTFSYSGWQPGETVEYWVIGPGSNEPFERGELESEPDEAGRITWQWTAPQGVWSGPWSMNARGIESYAAVQLAFQLNVDALPLYTSDVEPAAGTAGTVFNFSTDAWPQGDVIDLWVLPPNSDDPFWLGRIYGDPEADESGQGRTSWEWEAPPDIWGGVWTMNGRGYWSEISVQIPFVLDGPPPPAAPTASVTPTAAYPGDTLTFTANGYADIEEVAYWVNAPGRSSPVDTSESGELYSTVDGYVTWQWTIPGYAQPGPWLMVARGRRTGFEHQIGFTVLDVGQSGSAPETARVQPDSGPPGTTFRFTASNFSRNEPVQYWATAPDGQTFSNRDGVFADELGNVSLQWATTPDTMSGAWVMTLQGATSLKRVDIGFTISGPPAEDAPPTHGVTPEEGPPGTTFSFFATGFEHDEQLGWWVTTPAGRVLPGDIDAQATQQGRLDWQWSAPDTATPGRWMMVIQGTRSNVERKIPFVITSDEPDRDSPPSADRPTPTPTPSEPYRVEPGSGPPGTTFTFSVEGLQPSEAIGYWATAPDGTVYPAPEEINLDADKQGNLTWQWTAPDDAMPGEWTMVVQSTPADGVISDTFLVIPFAITAS